MSLTFLIFDCFSERTQRKLHRKQELNLLYPLCFPGWLEKQDSRPGLWLVQTFSIVVVYPVCDFWDNRKKKIAALASDIGLDILTSPLKPLNNVCVKWHNSCKICRRTCFLSKHTHLDLRCNICIKFHLNACKALEVVEKSNFVGIGWWKDKMT